MTYGVTSAGVFRRGRRGGELHPGSPAHPCRATRGERADPPAGDGTRADPAGSLAPHGAVDRRRRSCAAVTPGRRLRAVRDMRRPSTTSPNSSAARHDRHGHLPQRRHGRAAGRVPHRPPRVEITLGTDTSDALIDERRNPAGSTWRSRPSAPTRCPTGWTSRSPPTRHSRWWSPRRPLAQPTTDPVDDARHTPLIALPVGTGIRHRLDEACAAAGSRRGSRSRPAPRLNSPTSPSAGSDLAIVPQSVARARADLHALSIVPELRGRLVLAWRAAAPISPAARARRPCPRHCVSARVHRVGP